MINKNVFYYMSNVVLRDITFLYIIVLDKLLYLR